MIKRNEDTQGTGSAQSLRVEEGETVTLSPDSKRFEEVFRRIRPRSASEMRKLVGISDEMARTLREKGVCCNRESPAAVVSPEDLDSTDEAIRTRAVAITEGALYNYIVGLNPALLAPMEPAFASYIGKAEVLIHIATLLDIDIADGATLSIPATTQLVEANKVILRGSARINCVGYTKFKVRSIEKA